MVLPVILGDPSPKPVSIIYLLRHIKHEIVVFVLFIQKLSYLHHGQNRASKKVRGTYCFVIVAVLGLDGAGAGEAHGDYGRGDVCQVQVVAVFFVAATAARDYCAKHLFYGNDYKLH